MMKNVVGLLFCRQCLLPIVALCLGVFAGYYLLRGETPEPVGSASDAPLSAPEAVRRYTDNPYDTLDQLQQRLMQAEQARVLLAERVAALEAVIGKPGTYPDTATGTHTTETNEGTELDAPGKIIRTSVEALIATGIPEDQAALIQERLDKYDLKQLYLKDRASREGWLKTSRYNKEQRQAQLAYQELRPEIGDDTYDRMLYALGRNNRVVVRDIMQNSAAEQYGLRANDRIMEYDSQRVFTSEELSTLVRQGSDGALVLVRVQRDGQQLDFYLPSGPMGVRLATSRELP
jgi:membrane-associated protease RseP (regulator of RpoE activity)